MLDPGGGSGGSGGTLPMTQIADAAYKAGFVDRNQLATMIAIAMAESGGRANINNAGLNRNGTVDYGLWQINSVHGPDLSKIYDPYYNAQQAWRVHSELGQGYGAWSVYKNGRYAQFMADAARAADEYLSTYGKKNALPPNGVGKDMVGSPVKKYGQLQQGRPLRGSDVGRLVMAGAAKQVASRAVARKLGPEGEVDEEDFSFPRPELMRDTSLDTINSFIARRTEQYRSDPEVQAVIQQLEEQGSDVYTPTSQYGEIPQISEADVQQWLRTGLKQNAARGAAIARALGFGGTIHGVGARGNKSDHPHGNAIDLMTNDDREYGWVLANFFYEHREELGVKYIIFDDQIASASRGWEWRPYTHPSGNRSNPTLRHLDHPHISFYGG